MEKSIDSILNLFIRPSEPVCMPKGDKRVVFVVPDQDYLPERYRRNDGKSTVTRSNKINPDCYNIEVKKLSKIPDLTTLLELGEDEPFSLFIPAHSIMAGKLIEIFMEQNSAEEFMSVAVYCRNRINCGLFIYALSVAVLHRPDTKHLSIPSLSEILPHKFINHFALRYAIDEANGFEPDDRRRIVIGKDRTASDLEVEHRIAYFREDLGINLHHWHWHLVYPDNVAKVIVDKDRRGELFYYMHQQIIARYNFERLSNNLGQVKSFSDFREPIPEGYFPKLGVKMGTGDFTGRQSGATLKDINRSGREFKIQDLERWRDRIIEAIHLGAVWSKDGILIKLDEFKGIDILGNIVEASVLSPNRVLYGNLHNSGHIAIGSCHDPDYRHLEGFGVIGDNATAMRDPMFYRWHTFIDNVFQEHKNLLSPYTAEQLNYEDVRINDVQISIENKLSNSFQTFWQQSDIDISGGLDFVEGGTLLVSFTHLNHSPFSYQITVTNNSDIAKLGTVRIFMAPKHDESGQPFNLNKQRRLMIELDKFTATLLPGRHDIERRSDQSSVTIPFESTFPKVNKNKTTDSITEGEVNFCGCGWPQYMLIPKGIVKDGLPVDLFVMISDFAVDKVDQDAKTCCKNAVSYCGLKDKKYPDSRAMGYPFDRRPRDGVDTLGKFLTDNMIVRNMNIAFNDITVDSHDSSATESL